MSSAVRVTLTNIQTSCAWPFRDVYMQQLPRGEENLYTRYGVCMGFTLDASVQQRLFSKVYAPYCVVPLGACLRSGGVRLPLSAKALYTHGKVQEYTQSTIQPLATNIPALRVTLYTAAGSRSFCSTCPNAFQQLQGLCTPGLPLCSESLVLSPEDIRGTK